MSAVFRRGRREGCPQGCRRDEELDPLASELVELHEELQTALASANKVSIVQEEGAWAENLGHGVYLQNNIMAVDCDGGESAPAPISREESTSVVNHALEALWRRHAVCVTGQPGIGNTRGLMMCAIQCLLHRQAAVLYDG